MDKKQLHELAIAYAHARLLRKQYDAEKAPTKDELYNFTYDYQFAMANTERVLKECPKL